MTCKRLVIVLLVVVALYTVFTYFGTPSFRIRTVPG